MTSFSQTLKYLQTKSDLHPASVVFYSWGTEHLGEATEQCQKHTSEARFIAVRDDRYADGYVAEQKAASTHVGARFLQLTCCTTVFNLVIFIHGKSVEQESIISPI